MNCRIGPRALVAIASCMLFTALSVGVKNTAYADPAAAEPFSPENVGPSSNPDGSSGGGNPTPTPTPPCPTYVIASVDMLGISPNGSVSNPLDMKTANAQNMSCLRTIISGILSDCLVRSYRGTGYWDDAVIGRFDEIFFPQSINKNIYGTGGNPNKKQTVTQVSAAGAICWENMWLHPTGYRACSKGRAAIKEVVDAQGRKSCQVVPQSEVADACGPDRLDQIDLQVSFLRSSPISLLWDADADVEQEISIVDFPLNPSVKGAWYSWKASGKTPLLVSDPSHDGKIISGTQLFGPAAFGGKQTASADHSKVLGGPWKDGYEALGSLDQNGDTVISGNELDTLALWFDRNQDAVSQPGEVVSLKDAGVTALFYRSTRRDAATGNIVADIGFERSVDGKTVRGSSVDWFADTAATPQELTGKYILQHFPLHSSGASVPSAEELTSAESAYGASVSHDPLAGAWNWNYEATGGPSGESLSYLLIGVKPEDQKLYGYTVFGSPFTNAGKVGMQGLIDFSLFTGTFLPADGGARALKWSVDSGDSHLKTEATLAADGQRISGMTTAYLSAGGRFKKISYRWNATKMEAPGAPTRP